MLFIFFTPMMGSDRQSDVVMKDEAARPQCLFRREFQASRLLTRRTWSGGQHSDTQTTDRRFQTPLLLPLSV